MRIINVTSKTSAYVIIRNLNLKPGASGTLDVDILVLSELKSLRNLSIAGDIIISQSDFDYVVNKIASMSGGTGGGGDAPVKSVNEEIGDVVLDASKIKVADGDTIEEEFGQLSPVAYTGNYLDLINRPSGSGEPFSVIEWDPLVIDSVEYEFQENNASTSYLNGTMSVQEPPPIALALKDVGFPNSEDIVITNASQGDQTTITCNIAGTSTYFKGFSIETVTSLQVTPLDNFAYNNDGTNRSATVSFLIFPLEDGETSAGLSFNDIINKPNRINMETKVYLNDSNTYSGVSWYVTSSGSTVYNDTVQAWGNYNTFRLNIQNDILYLGEGYAQFDLVANGFTAGKTYGAIGVVQLDPTVFDVTTPFNIQVSQIAGAPQLTNTYPETGEISVDKNEQLSFLFSSADQSEYFELSTDELNGNLSVSGHNIGLSAIPNDHIDPTGKVVLRIEGNTFKLKNFTDNSYSTVYTKTLSFNVLVNPVNDSKTSWFFETITWSRTEMINGTLPLNSVDGSTIKVTNNGLFDNTLLYANDIVTPYNNKTKIIITRLGKTVSGDVPTAGDNPVSGNAVIAYTPTSSSLAGDGLEAADQTLRVRLSGSTNNLIQYNWDGLIAALPSIMTPTVLREAAQHFSYSSSIFIDVNSRNIFSIDSPGIDVNLYYYNVDETHPTDPNFLVAKTITIVIVNANSVNWGSRIIWADGIAPTISPDQYLVVTGITLRSTNINVTNSAILCTFSYYNKV